MADREIVCVLGMHRSGSSLLTQVLAGNGYELGPKLVDASPTNPMGHYEDRFVVDTNKRLLRAFGGTWDRPPDLPDGWLDAPAVQRELAHARGYRRDEVGRHQRFVFKDPRTSLVLPFWQEAFGEMAYAVTFRGRSDVVRSVVGRQQQWLAPDRWFWRLQRNTAHRLRRAYEPLRPIDPERASRLWDRYYAPAVPALAGARVVTVHFERLIARPAEEAARVVQQLRGGDAEVRTDMIRAELSHGTASDTVTDEALEWERRYLGA
jgi:hypothetical protein